jgi:hypothetical protein
VLFNLGLIVQDELNSSGHCLMLIPAPADGVVYRCFKRIAQSWPHRVTHQQLLIEGDVPLSTGFDSDEPSVTITRLLDANLDVIARIELHFAGLEVSYVRSGGHGPQLFRTSYFDEIRFDIKGASTLTRDEIGQVLLAISTNLHASAASGTSEFNELTEALPLTMRHMDMERRA